MDFFDIKQMTAAAMEIIKKSPDALMKLQPLLIR
jgi:hypothetical protein